MATITLNLMTLSRIASPRLILSDTFSGDFSMDDALRNDKSTLGATRSMLS